MSKVSGIYIILNTKNSKVYIGQAIDFKKRWREHSRSLNTGTHRNCHLQRAWIKDGKEAFKFLRLEYCEVGQLDEREQHYIDIYMAKGLCYNIAKDVKAPGRGVEKSEETRRKLSEIAKNRSEETLKRMSEGQKKRPPISEETRAKQRVSQKKRFQSEDQIQWIKEMSNNRPPVTDETRAKMRESSRIRHDREKELRNKTE